MTARSFASSISAACALALPASAQDVVWSVTGIPDLRYFEHAVDSLGDIDGDGRRDVIVAANHWDTRDPVGPWQTVAVLSSRDGTELRVDPRLTLPGLYGKLLAVGDMDGDGVDDYARTHAPFCGNNCLAAVEVRSGATGDVLWLRSGIGNAYARSFAGRVDLNGDGRPDLLIAAIPPSPSSPGWPGWIDAFDHSGAPLYTIHGFAPFGLRPMAGIGDLDGDGCDEFVALRNDPTLGAQVYVYSGRTGTLLRQHSSLQFDDFVTNSNCVVRCGDVDGDGRDDFAVSTSGFGLRADGKLMVFSSVTGNIVLSRREAWPVSYGVEVVSDDFDRDGVPDFAVGRPGQSFGFIELVSGRDGSVLAELRAPHPTSGYRLGGHQSAIVDPLPGDVFPNIVANDHNWIPPPPPAPTRLNGIGRVTCFRPVPTGVRAFGDGCAGTLRATPGIGFRTLDPTSARVHLTDAPPRARAFLLVGLSDQRFGPVTLPWSLAGIGLPGCSLHTAVDVVLSATAGTTGIDRGYAFVDVPRAPVRLFGQWLVLDQAGAALSKPLTW